MIGVGQAILLACVCSNVAIWVFVLGLCVASHMVVVRSWWDRFGSHPCHCTDVQTPNWAAGGWAKVRRMKKNISWKNVIAIFNWVIWIKLSGMSDHVYIMYPMKYPNVYVVLVLWLYHLLIMDSYSSGLSHRHLGIIRLPWWQWSNHEGYG